MAHYFVLVRAASQLLDAPPFRALAQLRNAIEEEYMPGGPPQSPIYDSFAFHFVLLGAAR